MPCPDLRPERSGLANTFETSRPVSHGASADGLGAWLETQVAAVEPAKSKVEIRKSLSRIPFSAGFNAALNEALKQRPHVHLGERLGKHGLCVVVVRGG